MGLVKWLFKKRPPPRVENNERRFNIRLHHGTGHVHTLQGVSSHMVNFITENIGRDEIYVQPTVIVNLREYSMAEVIEGEAPKR